MQRRCNHCGNMFEVPRGREYNALKYCSERCKSLGYKDKTNERQRRYKKRWKVILHSEDRGYKLGSAFFNGKRLKNFDDELKAIEAELRRLGVKK